MSNTLTAPKEFSEAEFFSYRLPNNNDYGLKTASELKQIQKETAIFSQRIIDAPFLGGGGKAAGGIVQAGLKVSKTYIAQQAAKYGIKSYDILRKEVAGKGFQVHHLIEQRFAGVLGQKTSKMLSIALSPKEHIKVTTLWRLEIGYKNSSKALRTGNVNSKQINEVAKRIYQDYPEILKALKLR